MFCHIPCFQFGPPDKVVCFPSSPLGSSRANFLYIERNQTRQKRNQAMNQGFFVTFFPHIGWLANGWWETKHFIGMALSLCLAVLQLSTSRLEKILTHLHIHEIKKNAVFQYLFFLRVIVFTRKYIVQLVCKAPTIFPEFSVSYCTCTIIFSFFYLKQRVVLFAVQGSIQPVLWSV